MICLNLWVSGKELGKEKKEEKKQFWKGEEIKQVTQILSEDEKKMSAECIFNLCFVGFFLLIPCEKSLDFLC